MPTTLPSTHARAKSAALLSLVSSIREPMIMRRRNAGEAAFASANDCLSARAFPMLMSPVSNGKDASPVRRVFLEDQLDDFTVRCGLSSSIQ